MSMSRVRELGKKLPTNSSALRLPWGQRVPQPAKSLAKAMVGRLYFT